MGVRISHHGDTWPYMGEEVHHMEAPYAAKQTYKDKPFPCNLQHYNIKTSYNKVYFLYQNSSTTNNTKMLPQQSIKKA